MPGMGTLVVHDNGGNPRTLTAEPQHCVCVFIGTSDAYENYRAILAQPLAASRRRSPGLQDPGQRAAHGQRSDRDRHDRG
jgi:hypothetical protein